MKNIENIVSDLMEELSLWDRFTVKIMRHTDSPSIDEGYIRIELKENDTSFMIFELFEDPNEYTEPCLLDWGGSREFIDDVMDTFTHLL